jgi:hypothetical protein
MFHILHQVDAVILLLFVLFSYIFVYNMTLLFSFMEGLENKGKKKNKNKKAVKEAQKQASVVAAVNEPVNTNLTSRDSSKNNTVDNINKVMKEKINSTYNIFLNEAVTQIESELKNQGNSIKDIDVDDVQSSAREIAIKKLVEFVDKIVNDETDAINVRADVQNMSKKSSDS